MVQGCSHESTANFNYCLLKFLATKPGKMQLGGNQKRRPRPRMPIPRSPTTPQPLPAGT